MRDVVIHEYFGVDYSIVLLFDGGLRHWRFSPFLRSWVKAIGLPHAVTCVSGIDWFSVDKSFGGRVLSFVCELPCDAWRKERMSPERGRKFYFVIQIIFSASLKTTSRSSIRKRYQRTIIDIYYHHTISYKIACQK